MAYDAREIIADAKKTSILDVAQALGLELRKEGKNYVLKDHDSFMISPEKNIWSWWSRGDDYRGKDVIKLVEVMKDVNFKDALKFVRELDGKKVNLAVLPKQKPFKYRLRDVKSFSLGEKYLHEVRKISLETIHDFREKGLITQAIYKNFKINKTEPVITFKHFDYKNNFIGGSIKGLWVNFDAYPDTDGRVKRTLSGNTPNSAMVFDIGNRDDFKKSTPDNPFKVYAFEAPIDLMSFYDLYKDQLDNCRLVSMNGLHKGAISWACVDALVTNDEQINAINKKYGVGNWLENYDKLGNKTIEIHVCVDNDEIKKDLETGITTQAGQDFLNGLQYENIKIVPSLPPLHQGMKKNDWNGELVFQNSIRERSKIKADKAEVIEI